MTAPGGDRNANVVLTADSSQYQQSMQQSTQQTNHLNAALSQLTSRLDGVTKRAGKKLFQFSAGDFAALAGATATAATFEKQMGSLKATADITGRSFSSLKGGIENTFTSMPVSRGQVIGLTEALTNLGVTSVKSIGQLTTMFTKLGAASGEDTLQLAQGLTQLSRLMGVTNAQQIGNYGNALLTVSKNAGVSATGVLAFSQSIAPLARQAGIGEAAIIGISAAFTKVGADGFVATNTFNKMVSDITNMTQTGSPELSKYAHLIGLTNAQFAKTDKTNALVSIFEAINKMGPKGIQILNQLGIDGVRAQSAISSVVQSGNLRQSVTDSVNASGNQKNINKGAKDAMGGLSDGLITLRNNFTQLGTEIGTTFLTPITKVLQVFNNLFGLLNKIIKPFAPIIAAVGALAGSFMGMAGAALVLFGIVTKLSTLRLLATGSPLAAFRGGVQVGRNPLATNDAQALAAAGGMKWYQKPFYSAGTGVGRTMGQGDGGRSMFNRGAEMGVRAPFVVGRFLTDSTTSMMNDSTAAPFERAGQSAAGISPSPTSSSFLLSQRIRAGADRLTNRLSGVTAPPELPNQAPTVLNNNGTMTTDKRSGGAGGGNFAGFAHADAAAEKAATSFAVAGKASTAAAVANVKDTAVKSTNVKMSAVLAGETKALAGSFARLGVQTIKTGAQLSLMGGRAVLSGVKNLASSLGPLGALMIGVPLAMQLKSSIDNKDKQDYSTSGTTNAISKYDQLLGQTSTNLADFGTAVTGATAALGVKTPTTLTEASTVRKADVTAASSGYKVTDKNFLGIKSNKDAVSYIQTLGIQHGGMDPKTLGAVKEDLINIYGPKRATEILNSYVNSGGQGDPNSVDYVGMGTAANKAGPGKAKGLIGQGFSSAVSSAKLDPNSGKAGMLAELNSILQVSGGALKGGNGINNSNSAKQVQAQLAAVFGGKATDYHVPTVDNSNLSDQGYKQAYGTQASSQQTVLLAFANSPAGKKFLKNAGIKGTENGLNDKNLPAVEKQIFSAMYPNMKPSTEASLKPAGALGKYAADNKLIQSVSGVGGAIADPKAQQSAQEALIGMATKLGGGAGHAGDALRKLADTVANGVDPALEALANGAAAFAKSNYEATTVPTMTRGQQTQYRAEQLNTTYKQMKSSGSDESKKAYATALQNYQQQEEANRQYLISVYTTVRDYNTQTARSYQDYYKSVSRSQRDFNIQMAHGERDFQLQRRRQVRDFNIQLAQQALQSAQTIYSPYQRVFDQQTADAGTVLQNLEDQNRRINEQTANIHRLQKMGVTQKTIDVLNLADPSNAQQLQNMVQGISNNPTMVKAINAAVNQRATATTTLTQSDFNVTFRQTVDGFHRSFNDMAHDFKVSRADALAAQKLGLADMATDFNIMIQRSATDLNTALTEITGSFTDLLPKVFKELGTSIGKYAPEYATTIQTAIDSIQIPGMDSGSTGTTYGPIGSKNNPQGTAGVRGINPKGKIGSYNNKGVFEPFTGPVDQSKLPYIVAPTTSTNRAKSTSNVAGAQRYAASQLGKFGWGASEMTPLITMWNRESGWSWHASNGGGGPDSGRAYGIPQSNPGNKMNTSGSDWRTDGATQIDWGLGYIKRTYGSPSQAWAHWQQAGNYDQGGVLHPGITKAVNLTGKPELILNPEQMQAMHTVGHGTPANNTSYRIYTDNSNTFTGITVVAQDPNQMAKMLAQKARIARLSTPPRATAS